MVFNILSVNRDGHVRQHSYLMVPSGAWRLAPAYDLIWSVGPVGSITSTSKAKGGVRLELILRR